MDAKAKQALVYLSDFIFRNYRDAKWSMVGDVSGIDVDWEKHPRLIRSQFFDDPDYPDAIYKFMIYIYEKDPNALNFVFRYIFGGKIPEDNDVRGALSNLNMLKGVEVNFSSLAHVIYLNFNEFPDDFYKDLIQLINNSYEHKLYPILPILIRKLFENLLIDILRSFYGTREIGIFYNVNRSRFNDFSTLIENCRGRLKDLEIYKDVFNEKLLNQIDKHRERGNSSAHTLSVGIGQDEIDSINEEVEFIVKSLFRTLKLIIKPS